MCFPSIFGGASGLNSACNRPCSAGFGFGLASQARADIQTIFKRWCWRQKVLTEARLARLGSIQHLRALLLSQAPELEHAAIPWLSPVTQSDRVPHDSTCICEVELCDSLRVVGCLKPRELCLPSSSISSMIPIYSNHSNDQSSELFSRKVASAS